MVVGFRMTCSGWLVQRHTGPLPKAFQECQSINFSQSFESSSGKTRLFGRFSIQSFCWLLAKTHIPNLSLTFINVHRVRRSKSWLPLDKKFFWHSCFLDQLSQVMESWWQESVVEGKTWGTQSFFPVIYTPFLIFKPGLVDLLNFEGYIWGCPTWKNVWMSPGFCCKMRPNIASRFEVCVAHCNAPVAAVSRGT